MTSAHVGALLGLLETQGPARVDLPHGLRARKEYGRLILERKDRAEGTPPEEDGKYALSPERYRTRTFPYHAQMRAQIPTGPCTKWIDYDKITQSLTFRTRQEGDVLALGPDEEGGMQCRKLTRVMIDRKVPERLRGRLVLPMDGTHVIWFPGYRIGAEYRVTDQTRTVLEIRLAAQDASEERLDDTPDGVSSNHDIAAGAASRDPIGETAFADFSSGCVPLSRQHGEKTEEA